MLTGILCDFPAGFPTSVGFRKYHLKHHAFQGHYDLDADLPSQWEAKLIGNGFIGKAAWLLFFPIFQGLRPPRLKEIKFANKWIWINIFFVLAFDVLMVYTFGWGAIAYFIASFFFGDGWLTKIYPCILEH
jgi:sphingolipid delta-4 desaturase